MTILRVENIDPSSDAGYEGAAANATEALRSGGVIAYPTETVYGLGCDYLNEEAFGRIIRLKGLEGPRPSILLIPGGEWIDILTPGAAGTPGLERLISAFWPGPLTLILPAAEGLPDHVVGPGRTISMRVSPDPFVRALMALYRRPITSTSANPTGCRPASGISELSRYFSRSGETIALAVDGGTRSGPPSTLVRVLGDEWIVEREGAIRSERIFEVRQT